MSTADTRVADSAVPSRTGTGKSGKIIVALLVLLLIGFVGLASVSLLAAQRTEQQRTTVGVAGGECEFEHRVPGWLKSVAGDDFHSFLDYPVIVAVKMKGLSVGDDNLAQLPDMLELRSLDLENSRVTSEGLQHVTRWRNLQRLNLTNTNVTDITPLAELPHLQSLTLSFSQVRKEHLAGLSQLESLTELGAGFIQVTDEDVVELARCERLEELNISASDLGEHGLQPLTALPNLKTLLLVKAKYDAADLEAFEKARPDVAIVK